MARLAFVLSLALWPGSAGAQESLERASSLGPVEVIVRRNPTTIQFVSFANGTTREVFAPSRQMPFLGRALSLSGDERSLRFAMIDHSDDEVMRVELAGL